MAEVYRKIPEKISTPTILERIESRRYNTLIRVAGEAWERLAPLVPTWNTSEDKTVPPAGLEGFHKLVWDPDNYHLEHQSLDEEGKYVYTRVERYGQELKIKETFDARNQFTYTELVVNEGRVIDAYTWVNHQVTKTPDKHTLDRIRRTLSPWKEHRERVIAKGMIGQITIPLPSATRNF